MYGIITTEQSQKDLPNDIEGLNTRTGLSYIYLLLVILDQFHEIVEQISGVMRSG